VTRHSAAVGFDERTVAIARRASVDAVAAELGEALEAAGVRTLLLKGPAIESWLYQPGERDYHDVDMMIAPGDLASAHSVLTSTGFFPVTSEDGAQQRMLDPTGGVWDELDSHAITYHRSDGLPGWVDVHRTLWETRAAGWNLLSAKTDRLLVAGRALEVPALPGRALVVALHALHHHVIGRDTTPAGQAVEDLRRAVACGEEMVWHEVARMAAGVRAELQLADALRLVAGGEQLAAGLGLPAGAGASDAAHAERILHASRYERLARTQGWRARSQLAARALFPSREMLRAQEPRARRGKLGLAVAYTARLGVVARHLPSGLRRWRRARAALAAADWSTR
jgi:hypothetical protein